MESNSFSDDEYLSADDLTPVEGLRAEPPPSRLAEALRLGTDPGDWAFDRLLPRALGVVSGQFWTPLAVAARAAEWFDDLDIQTVVDIGSGVGKFCIATALAGECRFVGIEQRPRLVRAARQLARLFSLEGRVQFLHGVIGDDAVPVADAYYLYNPFGENLFGRGDHLDEDVELDEWRYARDVASVEELLAGARAGTYVVTYNGFGGALPAGYTEIRVARDLPNVLRMSRKVG